MKSAPKRRPIRSLTKRSVRRGTILPAVLIVAMAGILGQVETCIGLQGDPGSGERGAPGEPGADGLPCWDLNGNGMPDQATEDRNGDGVVNVLDCRGEDGQDGTDGQGGTDGEDGTNGQDGLHCWDLNGNGVADLPDEDTNGDGVVDVEDCRGGFDCGDCDAVFVNEEPGSVTTDLIADLAVTTNKIDDRAVTQAKIDASGASNGRVLKTDGSAMYWDDIGVVGGPIVEFAESGAEVQLTTSWQTVLQVGINVPASGKLHVIGNGSFYIGYDTGYATYLGISFTDGGAPINMTARADYYDPDNGASFPVTTQYVGSVTPGWHTLYLVAMRHGTSGGIAIARPQISVTFFPD